MSRTARKLIDVSSLRTGKLNSNASVEGGAYPFFTCSKETLQIDRYAFDTEAVLLAGNNANGIFPLKYYKGQFNAYQRTYVIETKDPNVLSTRYLYYALRPALRHFESASIGAATQYLTKGILDNFEIQLPDIAQQNKIASILAAYDDLIENNRRRIALLEDAALLLYREWFVHFRFPGYEHSNFKHDLPDGWQRIDLLEAANALYGYAFKSKQFNEDGEGRPVVRIRDIPAGLSHTYTLEEAPEEKLLDDGDFLIGMDGIFHQNYWFGGKAWLNQRVVRISSKSCLSTGYLRQAVRKPIEDFNNTIAGTTVAHLGAKHLKMIDVLVPPKHILDEANEFFEANRWQSVKLAKQNQELAKARDLLLPRLLDGRLEVTA